jgi:hypothetical protein
MERENQNRVAAYRKDKAIEDGLFFVNKELSRIAKECPVVGDAPELPLVFVVGIQRSGSTMLMQLLAECFRFTYPDNIVARFWEAPFVGVIASRSLRDQYKNQKQNLFASDYGMTMSPLEPHEFGYFWTKWFGFEPVHQLSEEQLSRVDLKGLSRALFLMEHFGRRPLLFKIVPLSLNLDFLASHFPKALFVHIHRDLLYVAQSTYNGRIERYGDENVWWSLKPAQYEDLKKLAPVDQVAGQVYYSQKRVEECLDRVPDSRKITVRYESLCRSPARIINRLREFFGPEILQQQTKIPESFSNRNVRKLDIALFEQLQRSLERFGKDTDKG